MGTSEHYDAPPAVRWNALDPNDEHTALIVPAEDLRALEGWAAAAVQRLRGAVTPSDIVKWLRGRTGAHGGGFTSADDVADAIEREFTDAR